MSSASSSGSHPLPPAGVPAAGLPPGVAAATASQRQRDSQEALAGIPGRAHWGAPPQGPVFLRALWGASGRVAPWLVCWLVPLLLAALLAFTFVDWFAGTSAHAYAPGSLRNSLDEAFRFDHREALALLRSDAARGGVVLLGLLMLWGAFAAGGWLQVFREKTNGHSLRRFLWGGAAFFWRFVRVWLLTLLLLSFVTWLCFGWPWRGLLLGVLLGLEGGDLELLESERSAVLLGWLQAGLHALLFALSLVWADYTRTRLALQDARSALWAGLCTFVLLLAHPLRTLRPFLGILLVEGVVVWGLGSLSWSWSRGFDADSGLGRLLLVFFVGQLALVFQTIARGARYHAAVAVSRQFVPPSVSPDPWAKRVGGPGGPQYPIDDADDVYAVSL